MVSQLWYYLPLPTASPNFTFKYRFKIHRRHCQQYSALQIALYNHCSHAQSPHQHQFDAYILSHTKATTFHACLACNDKIYTNYLTIGHGFMHKFYLSISRFLHLYYKHIVKCLIQLLRATFFMPALRQDAKGFFVWFKGEKF